LLVASSATYAASITWTNLAGGDWNVPVNWSPNQVPGSGDSATINRGNVFVNTTASANNLVLGGSLPVAATAVLNMEGGGSGDGSLTNYGTVNWGAGEWTVDGALWLNQPGAQWNIVGEAGVMTAGGSSFNNAGTLTMDLTNGECVIGESFNNSGTVRVLNGSIHLDYLAANSGELLFGVSCLTNFGNIGISGRANLGGTVGIVLLGGYVPATNDSFTVLTYDSYGVPFDSVDFPLAATWTTNYSAAAFTVTVSGINRLTFTGPPLWTANGFLLNLYVTNNIGSTVVYASTDLTDWTPIYTNPPAAGNIQFLDSGATNCPMRFYRAVEQ
jgi:hypothetical protein